ncbi:MAG: hypothetical protein JW943_07135 [Deltaproteobacteria bacterium]|nr:hypothetical protein [Deltaproteobacteria bacterium]
MKERKIIFILAVMILHLCFLGCSDDKPLVLKEGGPLKTKANTVFNVQPDGSAAMWLIVENASERTHVMFDKKEIRPVFHNSQKLTLTVPRELYSKPGRYEIYIFNPQNDNRSNSLFFTVE